MAARTCVLLGRGLSQGPADRKPRESMHQRATSGVCFLTSWDRQANLKTRVSIRGGRAARTRGNGTCSKSHRDLLTRAGQSVPDRLVTTEEQLLDVAQDVELLCLHLGLENVDDVPGKAEAG